jgi:uncharacterized protein (TIGR00299 family) protein
MRIAYFDCFSGASGDMILGALLDAGLKPDLLRRELNKLHLDEFDLRISKTVKSGISATKFEVTLLNGGNVGGGEAASNPAHDHGHNHDHDHDHHHDHGHDHAGGGHDHGHGQHDHDHETGSGHGPHAHANGRRGLSDVTAIIDASSLSAKVKEKSRAVFRRLAEAEAKVHACGMDEIHFHEVGAVDAIVDIVGAVIGLEALGIETIRASSLHLGSGFVDCAHGRLPVPPPAVTELIRGVPCYSTDVEGELVTPTGAAILSTLTSSFGPFPAMTVERTGYGAGFRDLANPNVLRLVIGETAAEKTEDRIRLIETNIDDMNPQFYDHIMDRLFASGAKDVFLTPIIMKKSRPGLILSVIAAEERTEPIVSVLLRETTTLGVRISDLKKRMVARRDIATVSTAWGDMKVKIRGLSEKEETAAPEYDDCRRVARETGLPIQAVYDEVKRVAEKEILKGRSGPRRKPAASGTQSKKGKTRKPAAGRKRR